MVTGNDIAVTGSDICGYRLQHVGLISEALVRIILPASGKIFKTQK